MIDSRRHDLDWLRIIAFVVLIYFHAAIIFVPDGLPLIRNAELSGVLQWFVDISHQFRLALLFFVSGAGVGFARRHRDNHQFLIERSRRLLIPLVVGILIVVPPMVYAEKLFVGAFTGSFWSFYPAFFTEGVYPQGNLSWHHLWFIAYLYLFCLLGLLFYARLIDDRRPVTRRIRQLGAGSGVFLFIVPLLVVEIALRAPFPGFRDLIHDWASFFHWFLIFLAGFVVASNERFLENATRLRHVSLMLALFSTWLLFAVFYRSGRFDLDPADEDIVIVYVMYCAVRMTMVWSCILSCVGFAGRFLRRGHAVLDYLNGAVYPLFILHLTVITVLGYFVTGWQMNLWLKYFIITTGTFVIVLPAYHLLIRPFALMRLAFGVK